MLCQCATAGGLANTKVRRQQAKTPIGAAGARPAERRAVIYLLAATPAFDITSSWEPVPPLTPIATLWLNT